MICVLTACGNQESREADLNPEVLSCFGVLFPKKIKQMLAIKSIHE